MLCPIPTYRNVTPSSTVDDAKCDFATLPTIILLPPTIAKWPVQDTSNGSKMVKTDDIRMQVISTHFPPKTSAKNPTGKWPGTYLQHALHYDMYFSIYDVNVSFENTYPM